MKSLQHLSLSMPTYLYLPIHTCLFPSSPIYSYPSIWIYLYMLLVIQKKCNQYQHCKSCNCCTAKFKRTRTYEVRNQTIPKRSTFTKLHYTTAKSSLHTNGTTPDVCRNAMIRWGSWHPVIVHDDTKGYKSQPLEIKTMVSHGWITTK